MRPFIVGVDPENLWLTLPAVPSSAGSGSGLFPSFDSDLDLDLVDLCGKQRLDEDYFPSVIPTGAAAAGTLKPIRPARPSSSSHLDRLGFAPLSPVAEVSESPIDSDSDDDEDGFDPSPPSSCDGEDVARFSWLEDDEMASSLAYGGGAGMGGAAAAVNDMDVPFGIGGSPTGPAGTNQQLYPGYAFDADPPFDLSEWLLTNNEVHSPIASASQPSTLGAGGAMVPPLLGAQYQSAPAPLQSRFTPDRQRPFRPPQAATAYPGQAVPPVQPAPAQSSSPLVDLLREQVAANGRSTSLPPPSQPKPLRRRTQDSADIPSIASSDYSTLFPQAPKGDGMATLAPTPPLSGRVEAKSPRLKQRTAAATEEAPTETKKEGKAALYRLGNLGLEGLNGQKRPALPSMYSSYAPLPTPSSGSDSQSGTPSPLPTPYPSNPNAPSEIHGISGPTPDHPLSEAETRDIWERLKRDFADVDPAHLRGPFRQLALQSLKENGIVPQTGGGAANPAVMTKRPLPPASTAQQSTPRQPAATAAAANLSAGETAARLTVSPKEAFLDYDDVSHRLSDPARGRSSPRPLSTALFGAALMERNPSSPITFTGSPSSGGKGRLTAPAMDRRTSMPEVWAKNGPLHHHFVAGTGGGPPTPGGGGAGQHIFERRSSPSSGLRLPPHQLPKNAMRISEGAHHDGLHAQSSAEQPSLPLEMVDDYSPSSEEDPSPPVPEPLGAPLFGPVPDVKSKLTPGGGHVVVRSSGDSYFPQGITGDGTEEEGGLRYLAAPSTASADDHKGAMGGKHLPSQKGRSRSHPPEAGTRTSGRARTIRRRSSTSSPEGSEDGDGDVQMGGATTRASARHSDGGAGQWSTAKRRHAPAKVEASDDEEEEEEDEEEEEEEEEDEDELDDDDDDYAETGASHHKAAAASSSRRKAATTSTRKRKSAASAALDSLSDASSPATSGPSKKRQRHSSSSPPRGWGSHVSAEQRKVHGRSGHGSIKCDYVDPQTGERCDVVFRRPYDLARHKETIHEAKGKKKQQWICGQCKGSFSRKDALMRHCRIRNHSSGL